MTALQGEARRRAHSPSDGDGRPRVRRRRPTAVEVCTVPDAAAACSPRDPARPSVGRRSLLAEVDPVRRADTMRNHTGTHLLHRALRNVVGDRARQAGSLVAPGYLRFDFPFERGLSEEELRSIEAEVRAGRPGGPAGRRRVDDRWPGRSSAGADAFFDEKYGDEVRTIRVEGYSHELCGGTHCRASGQIGNFVITGERSIGSGMRRIEAVTGAAADRLMADRFATLGRASEAVGARSPEALGERIGRSRRSCATRGVGCGRGRGRRAPAPGRAGAAGRGGVARACAWRRGRATCESVDALKGYRQGRPGRAAVGCHRARPRGGRAAAVRDRQRRPRGAGDRGGRAGTGGGSPRSRDAAGDGRRWPRGRGPGGRGSGRRSRRSAPRWQPAPAGRDRARRGPGRVAGRCRSCGDSGVVTRDRRSPRARRSTWGRSSPRRWSSRSTRRATGTCGASAGSARGCRTCSRGRSRTSRRSSTTARSPSRRPRRWPGSARARS